jgi:ABC-type multidrug transport system fused ATPase/permease subunit
LELLLGLRLMTTCCHVSCHFSPCLFLSVIYDVLQRFLHAMAPYQAACVNSAAAANWLSARLQLLAAVLVSAVAAFAATVAAVAATSPTEDSSLSASTSLKPGVYLLQGSNSTAFFGGMWATGSEGNRNAGDFSNSGATGNEWASRSFRIHLLGLALAYCLPIVQLLNGLLTSSAETEQEMVAVERVSGYLQILQPEQQQVDRQQQQQQDGSSGSRANGGAELMDPLLLQWQQDAEQQQRRQHQRQLMVAAAAAAGTAVAFVDVVMRYKPHRPPSLRGVSFKVYPGQKLGICGRTGKLPGCCRTLPPTTSMSF